MIYEAQSPEVCQLVSRNFPEETIIFYQYRNLYTLFLCKVISFFLSNSSCAWKKVSLDGLFISNTTCLQTFHVTGCSSSIYKNLYCISMVIDFLNMIHLLGCHQTAFHLSPRFHCSRRLSHSLWDFLPQHLTQIYVVMF